MADPRPLVSVVIPVHNGEPYLAEAIESVLAQTHKDVEIIVSDDGSRDRSLEIARGFGERVRCLEHEHSGAGPARNRGVAAAAGEHLAFLDCDDRWHPQKLERQLQLLASSGAEIAFALARQFVSPELSPEQAARFEIPAEPQAARQVGVMLTSRASFDRVGPFSGERMGEFMEWLLRAREAGLREVVADEVLLERRVHPAGHSISGRAQIGEYAEILKQALDRRRAAGAGERGPG
jgi:glycosyltransferase involved in cell wall biosynthesis